MDIKSTHPEFEQLAKGHATTPTPALLDFLEEADIPHHASAGGVRLSPDLELLDVDLLAARLARAGKTSEAGSEAGRLQVEIHRVTGSTNDVVMQRLSEPGCDSVLCAAEMQTAGKGRRGRAWVSPFGRNIYLTYGRYLRGDFSSLGGLSIVAGMQVVDTLRSLGVEGVGLKWPNDILFQQGKLGGILVELQATESRGTGVVVGVGINFALSAGDSSKIDQPWSVIGDSTQISRNLFLGELSVRLIDSCEVFNQSGFLPFAGCWPDYNLYVGQPLQVVRGEEVFMGTDAGIDAEGNLVLETDQGTQLHNAGEVSVRSGR